MRYITAFAFIVVATASTFFVFNYNYHLHMISVAKNGLKQCIEFYQNLPKILKVNKNTFRRQLYDDDDEDGYDNEDTEDEVEDTTERTSKGEVVETQEHPNDYTIEIPDCKTWTDLKSIVKSLLKLLGNQVDNLTGKRSLSDYFAHELEYIDLIIEGFYARLMGHLETNPTKEGLKDQMFEKIGDELRLFQDSMKNVTTNVFDNIDRNNTKSNNILLMCSVILLKYFNNFIREENENHLECGCHLAQEFYEYMHTFTIELDDCWYDAEQQFGSVFNTTKKDLNLYTDITFEIVTDAMERGGSMYTNYLRLPAEVCSNEFFF